MSEWDVDWDDPIEEETDNFCIVCGDRVPSNCVTTDFCPTHYRKLYKNNLQKMKEKTDNRGINMTMKEKTNNFQYIRDNLTLELSKVLERSDIEIRNTELYTADLFIAGEHVLTMSNKENDIFNTTSTVLSNIITNDILMQCQEALKSALISYQMVTAAYK